MTMQNAKIKRINKKISQSSKVQKIAIRMIKTKFDINTGERK